MNVALYLLAAGSLVATAGDIVMKKWTETGNWVLYAVGLSVYLVGLNFLAHSYRYENIAVASLIFVILNVSILSVVSWLYFKEALSTLQIAGLIVGIAALAMLELG